MKNISKEDIINFIKKYKISLIILFVVIITLIIGIIISDFGKEKNLAKNKNEKISANTHEKVIQEENYEGLKFTNISLITKNNYSTFTADVTNTTKEDSKINDISIILKDKNGIEVVNLRGNIGEPLKSNETRTITAVTKGNLKNVTSKTIKKYENTAQK